MEKTYLENIKLTAIRNKLFSNLSDKKHVSIFNAVTISSGDYLPTNKMIDGEFDVYGGGGTTTKKHNEYNVETETFGIGRVGARCGCVFKIRPKSWVTDNALYATKIDDAFDIEFLIHYLNFKNLNQFANTAAQPVISLKRISGILIPILDLNFQMEIVEILNGIDKGFLKIEDDRFGIQQTLNFVTSKEELSNELTNQLTLVKKLRQQLLQDAVQGKLVEQNATDEPANELLKKIKVERLNRDAALARPKKEKPLPPIKPEEIPFEIPENWVWCRLGEIVNLVTSGSRDWAKYYSSEGEVFVRMGNLSRDSYNLKMDKIQYVNPPKNQEGNRTRLEADDILISITGEVGNLGLIPKDFGEAYINQHTALVRLNKAIVVKYVCNLFLSRTLQEQFKSPQRGMKNSFRLSDIDYLLIPLPPLAEQNRIVQKLDELMQYCNELEANIKQGQSQNEKLLQQVLREALRKEPDKV